MHKLNREKGEQVAALESLEGRVRKVTLEKKRRTPDREAEVHSKCAGLVAGARRGTAQSGVSRVCCERSEHLLCKYGLPT